MRALKVLYGVSGIGNGHANRQLPIIEYFAQNAKVVIFAYDSSYAVFARRFANHSNVSLIKIAIPFVVGTNAGLDFKATLDAGVNQGVDFFRTDYQAMAQTQRLIGKPDLVISDYEPLAAMYAYAYGSPLVTLDQQSRFLCGEFPDKLGGFTFTDEVFRLRMFFPKAEARIVCSFYNFERRQGNYPEVAVFPPTIKTDVVRIGQAARTSLAHILVYISAAREFGQPLDETIRVLSTASLETGVEFHVFVKKDDLANSVTDSTSGIHIYPIGDSRFIEVLSSCRGIVSTAGHTLLSEAMFLGIPVYAIPVAPYEQYLNAISIKDGGFGVSHDRLDLATLLTFIQNLRGFSANINSDQIRLNRGIGQVEIIKFLQKKFDI